jgi:hypothetical protein
MHARLALTNTAPDLAVVLVHGQNRLQIFHSLPKLFLGSEDQADGVQGRDGFLVRSQGIFVREQGIVQVAEDFGEASCEPNISNGASEVSLRKMISAPICIHTASLRTWIRADGALYWGACDGPGGPAGPDWAC